MTESAFSTGDIVEGYGFPFVVADLAMKLQRLSEKLDRVLILAQ